ncbi:putative secreted protein (type I secretion substrate) [Rhizobium sp. PP-F2F-G38]|nr:putative secreted protein (type I secretion substrate) [Rhizobium sp. PP-F2F-G38]
MSDFTVEDHTPAGTVVATFPDAEGTYKVVDDTFYWGGWPNYTRMRDYFEFRGNDLVTTQALDFRDADFVLRITTAEFAISGEGSIYIIHINDAVETFLGTANQEELRGTAGADIFNGMQGDDFLYGERGIDKAIFSGNFSDYVFKQDTNSIRVYDTRAGGDGKDRLQGIEVLQFADRTVDASALVTDTAPGNIQISNRQVSENLPAGTVVGVLTAVDPEGRALTYSLSDNRAFRIDGDRVVTTQALDFETLSTHHITITATDPADNSIATSFQVDVLDAVDIQKGTANADTLRGAAGVDNIQGFAGNDRLVGNSGDDTLIGDAGNDKLFGGNGNDRLYGGAGADYLSGGTGKDVFIYRSISQSTSSAVGRDTISDFDVKSGDKISLSDIDANTKAAGNQAFSFIGTKDFSGKAGELRYEKQAFNTYIYADVNGDGKSDFSIHLDQATPVISGFFLL